MRQAVLHWPGWMYLSYIGALWLGGWLNQVGMPWWPWLVWFGLVGGWIWLSNRRPS